MKRVVKEQKPWLLLVLGLASITLIGLSIDQGPHNAQFSPGAITPVSFLPAYWISASLLLIAGITIGISVFEVRRDR